MEKRIVIQVAMKEEGLGLASKLGLRETDPLDRDFGFRKFTGARGSLELILVLQGTDPRHDVEQIGLEAAAVCATLIIDRLKPDLLLNFGTAGGFESRGWKIGDVGVVTEPIVFHDRRVSLPGYQESQEGRYPVADSSALSLRAGRVSSGSSLEMSPRDLEMLLSQQADLKEMECAAIAWVAHRKLVPFLSLKSVTDLVDHPEPVAAQFLQNLARASLEVQDAVIRVLDYLEAHPSDPVFRA